MHNHLDRGLNLRSWLILANPAVVVECGAGHGELTKELLVLSKSVPFTLHVINDALLPFNGFEFHQGVSYRQLEQFDDESVDFCVIDTDHNYWTLAKELDVLHRKLRSGGYMALHDVATFYHDTGMALQYSDGSEYPRRDIEEQAGVKGGLGNALMDFLSRYRFDYQLITFTSASQGAALVKKVALQGVSILVPGKDAVYAENR